MQWSYGAQSQEHDGVLQGPAAPIRLHRTHTLAAKARGTDTPARPQRRSLCLAPADILSTVANIPGIMLLRVCVLDTELGFGVPVRCLRRASEHPHGLDL
jgi:hypothetical protein